MLLLLRKAMASSRCRDLLSAPFPTQITGRSEFIMQLRQLGQTGLFIPPIVFGATSLGNLFREIPPPQKADIVQSWVHSGLSPIVIDSAGKYGAGLSLEVIGHELSRLNADPTQVMISNKLGWRRIPLTTPEPTFEPGAWFGLEHDAVQDIGYEGIMRCFHEGNQLLGNYRAQIVSVHDPDEYLAAARNAADRSQRFADIVDAYRALMELKANGEVAAVGVGAKHWKTIQELAQHCDFDWVMFANSFTIMHHPPELIDFVEHLGSHNVGIVNSALFHGGFLVGGDFFDYRKLDPANATDQRHLNWRERFQKICAEHAVKPFQVGVAFGLAHPAVTAVALSSSRATRTNEHIQTVTQEVPKEVWTALIRNGLVGEQCSFLI